MSPFSLTDGEAGHVSDKDLASFGLVDGSEDENVWYSKKKNTRRLKLLTVAIYVQHTHTGK